MITPEVIGKNMVSARSELGYTQKNLADKLAISPQNVSKWERGVSTPDVITLLQISEILNKDITYFLTDSHEVAAAKPTAVPLKYVDSVFSNTNWYKQQLSEIKRSGIYLFDAIMRHTKFSQAELIHCKIKDCEFAHCDSVGLKLNDSEIQHSYFRFMDMKDTVVSGCKVHAAIYRCKIANSEFSATVFDNCGIEAEFEGCTFSRIALKNCKRIHHSTFTNCVMDNMSEQAFRAGGAKLINCTIKEN